jgi:hypothetical protein
MHRANIAIIPLLAIVGFGFLLVTMNPQLNIYDEGIIVYGSALVANDRLPYRDFWTNYGPGQYFLLAAVFKLFGPSILAERTVDLLTRTGIAVLGYVLAVQHASRIVAVAAFGAALTWLSVYESYAFPLFPAVLFSLASVVLLGRVFDSPAAARRVAWSSGAMVGVSGLFRPDIAVLAALGQIGALLIHYWGSDKQLPSANRVLVAYVAGAGLIAGTAAIALVSVVPLQDAVEPLITYPAQVYPYVRSLPYPPFPSAALLSGAPSGMRAIVDFIGVYLPVVVVPMGLLVYLEYRRSTHVSQPRAWLVLLLTSIIVTLYVKGAVRVSPLHLAQSMLPAIALLAIVACPRTSAVSARSRWLRAPTLICLTLVAAIPLPVLIQRLPQADGRDAGVLQRIKTAYWATRSLCGPQAVARARCFATDPHQLEAIRYVVARVPAEERIYVGAGRHDRLFAADVMFYFLAERDAATKFYDLIPGLQTTHRIQQHIISDLQKHGVRYVVLVTLFDNVAEQNLSAISTGVTTLDDFIRDHYKLDAQFGSYAVHTRREH